MALPASFAKDGFVSSADARKRRWMPGLKRPGILIGTEGETNTGKSEFIFSCPGPGLVLAVDRGTDAIMDNPTPPPARRSDFAICEIKTSMPTQAADHVAHWKEFYAKYLAALANPDARTVGIDGDSDTWELQRLAEFDGKFTQVPSILYVKVNAARRVMIARAFDSGKVIVATNKIKDEYVTKRDANGNPELKDGKEVRVKSGQQIRQGFDDDNYLWHIQIKHLVREPRQVKVGAKIIDKPMEWGIRILKAKANPQMQGMELWGGDCNFAGLVQTVYPNIEMREWGL